MAFKWGFPLFLVSAGIFAVLLILPGRAHAGFFSSLLDFLTGTPGQIIDRIPAIVSESKAEGMTSMIDADLSPIVASGTALADNPLTMVRGEALVAPLNPIGTMSAGEANSSGQIFIYTVRSGDTIGSIAKSFDVSENTIRWANSITSTHHIAIGEELLILPVSGVQHEVKKGDTVASIAKRYHASIQDIIDFNGLAPDEEPTPGTTIMVPSGELIEAAPITSGSGSRPAVSSLPVYAGYYLRPILGGRKTRGIHGFNGIDLANSCGLPVFASADGAVLIAKTTGWNGGYGKYIVIAHGNGTQTLYAHLSQLNVSPGDSVAEGKIIGQIGSTGNSTGCHVHFEVRGAKNPF